MSNERIEKIKDSIDETDEEIKNIQLVIQKLETAKDTSKRFDERNEIQKLIEKFSNEISYLEDIREDDERALIEI
jgi:hypothetical protein